MVLHGQTAILCRAFITSSISARTEKGLGAFTVSTRAAPVPGAYTASDKRPA